MHSHSSYPIFVCPDIVFLHDTRYLESQAEGENKNTVRLSGKRVSKESTARSLSAPAPQGREKPGTERINPPDASSEMRSHEQRHKYSGVGNQSVETHETPPSTISCQKKKATEHRTMNLTESDHKKMIGWKRGPTKNGKRG